MGKPRCLSHVEGTLDWLFTEQGSARSESEGKVAKTCPIPAHKHAMTKISRSSMPGPSSGLSEPLLELLQKEPSTWRGLSVSKTLSLVMRAR